MRQPVSALVYPAFHTGEEWLYLILHRIAMPQLGLASFWQGVTGAAEEKETISDTARRELLEETNITADRLEPINYSYTIPLREEWEKMFAPGTKLIVEHVFAAMVRKKYTPQLSWEHDHWKWCSLKEALQMLFYPGNIKGLMRCHDFLNRISLWNTTTTK
jgi:8-oxo-dGTP pyrophosphatase MutT (NUDIX family)